MGELGSTRRQRVLWGLGLGVVLAAVTVNAVLTLFRVVEPRLGPGPIPSPPAASSPALPSVAAPTAPGPVEPAGDVRLPGAGSDVVFVQSAAAIYRINLATGAVVRTITPELTQFSSFVARPGWVVSKTVDNDSGVVVRDGQPAQPLPPGLRMNGRVYSAGRDRLWLVPEDATAGYRTAIKVDLDGHRVGTATIRLPDEFGLPNGDQNGQLLITNAGGAYQADPSGLRRLGTGQLLAIGTHHVLTWDCDDQARCNAYRTVRATGRRALLGADRQAVLDVYQDDPDHASSYQGVLSPDGTHAALAGSSRAGNDGPLFVLNLRTGRDDLLPGSTTDLNPNAQVAWTANSRWLLALTDNQLRAYDTTTATVRTLPVGEPLQHLVSANAAGF